MAKCEFSGLMLLYHTIAAATEQPATAVKHLLNFLQMTCMNIRQRPPGAWIVATTGVPEGDA